MPSDSKAQPLQIGDEVSVLCRWKVVETFTVESHRNVRLVPIGVDAAPGEKLPILFCHGGQTEKLEPLPPPPKPEEE